MRKTLFLIILIYSSVIVYSQDVNVISNYDKKYNDKSTSLVGGRYEFIMSDMLARLSFKVDKYTGKVYQLVRRSDESLTFDLLEKEAALNDVIVPNKINYQLYMSGLKASFCFLININTGTVWQIVTSRDDENILLFQLIE